MQTNGATAIREETFTSSGEFLAYQKETVRLARENLALAEANRKNLWPWRYRRWKREHEQINRNNSEINRRLDVAKDVIWTFVKDVA